MTWRNYLTIILGRAIADEDQEPERQLSDAEQRAVQEDAMSILMGGPQKPYK